MENTTLLQNFAGHFSASIELQAALRKLGGLADDAVPFAIPDSYVETPSTARDEKTYRTIYAIATRIPVADTELRDTYIIAEKMAAQALEQTHRRAAPVFS